MAKKNIIALLKHLGPGLLFAGAAVGVSHLVQSTKAGATYGFDLLLVILFVNLFKYPFFEFGTRYAMATNETLIDGYKKQGTWAITLFILLTLGTMFTIQAAVTIVTAGLATNLFAFLQLGAIEWSFFLLFICSLILLVGRYSFLDNLMKIIIIVLTIATIGAVVSTFFIDSNSSVSRTGAFEWDKVGIAFIIALMGWMPAPLDLSVWSSIWSLEKKKIQPNTTLKNALFDFNVGYIGTTLLAVCFLALGALVMYGTGEKLSPKGAVFAGQLINLYTNSLGEWAKPLITIAAFTTMFSTTLTCLDAFPRVLSQTLITLFPAYENKHSRKLYWCWIVVVIAGALLLLNWTKIQMGSMIKMATILSFLTAPFLAFLNYRLVTSQHTPLTARPPKWLLYLSWLGLAFLIGFSILYLSTLIA